MERRMFEERGGAAGAAGGTQVVAAPVATSQSGAMVMQGTPRGVGGGSTSGGGGALNGAGGALRAPAGAHFDSYSWQQNLGIQASMERTSDAPYEAHHPMYYTPDVFSAVPLEGAPHHGKAPLLEPPQQQGGAMKAGQQMVCLKPAMLHEAAPTSTTTTHHHHHLQQVHHHHHQHHQHHATHHHQQHLQQQQQQQVVAGNNVLVPSGALVVTGASGISVMPPATSANPPPVNGTPMEGGGHLQVLGLQAAPPPPSAPLVSAPTALTTTITTNSSSSSSSSNNNKIKKKKKIVKSKKKQIREGEDTEALDCAVYDDDLVYIRSAGCSSHTVDISAQQLDPKALRLLCPLPLPPQMQDESEDEFKTLAGVGVWEYGKVWNHHLTIKFLECLHRNKKRMFSRDSRRLLYMELSALFQREDHKDISTEELEKKWCSLLSSYKRNQNRLRGGEEVSWSYYKIMDDIMVEGRHIRRQNRERPKKGARPRRLTDDEAELRGVKGVCRRKNKKLKQQLQERLARVVQQRERSLAEGRANWEAVKESISSITRNMAMLNSSVIMLGHTLGSFLAAVDKMDKIKKESSL